MLEIRQAAGMGLHRVSSALLSKNVDNVIYVLCYYEGRGRALNTSWTHGGNDRGLDF